MAFTAPHFPLHAPAEDVARYRKTYLAGWDALRNDRWKRLRESKIGGTAVNKVEHWIFQEYDDDDKLIEAATTAPPNVYGFGHEAYYRNVLSVLRGEARADTDGRAGRKSLELILGIYESAKTGREVPLPLRVRT